MPESAVAMEHVARQVSAALEAADLSAFSELLDPAVRWGAPGDPSPACQNRLQVLAWYERGRRAGVRARVGGTIVSGDRILVELRVIGPAGAGRPGRAGRKAAGGGAPASAEPASAEPASAEPASAEPASAEPAGREVDPGGGGEAGRWQVLTVRDGRVVDIVGFDERDEAAAHAGLAASPGPAPTAPPGERVR